jgi:hypothetical protein
MTTCAHLGQVVITELAHTGGEAKAPMVTDERSARA